MIITEILGNLHDNPELAAGHVERIVLDDAALVKRVQRLTTDHDNEVGLRLPAGHPPLRDGDVLHADGSNTVVITAEPTDVVVIHPVNVREMGFVAHSLGNRHLPAQFDGEAMIVQYDSPVVDFLEHHRVPYERRAKVMPTPFRHAEHTH